MSYNATPQFPDAQGEKRARHFLVCLLLDGTIQSKFDRFSLMLKFDRGASFPLNHPVLLLCSV